MAWWTAEGTGRDAAGTNTAVLTPGVGYTSGKVGKAFDFSGTDGRVIVPDAPQLDFGTGDFSIETWIRPLRSVTDYGVMTIVDKRLAPDISHSLGYEFDVMYGQLAIRLSTSLSGDGELFGPAGPDLLDENFHHVAVTVVRDSVSGGNLYVDGRLVLTFDPTRQSGSLSTTEPVRIGNHATPGLNCFFKGQIDEVCLYARALAPAEVEAICIAGDAGKCRPPFIASQPKSQLGYWGKSAMFEVGASGEALTYQWWKAGEPITDGTTSSLVLGNLQMTDAGAYSVVVANAEGSVTSNPALLTMNPAGVSIALHSVVTIEGVVGLVYGIQASTNLSDVGSWQGVANIPLSNPTQLWFDVQPATRPQRYYRVVPGPIPIP